SVPGPPVAGQAPPQQPYQQYPPRPVGPPGPPGAPPSIVPIVSSAPPPAPHPGAPFHGPPGPPRSGFTPPPGYGIGPGGTRPLPSPTGTGPMPVVRPPGGVGAHSYLHQGTRIDLNDQARAIGTQIAAVDKGFLQFDRIQSDTNQLRADYERLRLSHELSR